MRNRTFDPLFTTEDQSEGTTTGLAMVHRIVTGCGETIAVDTTPEQGTTFVVYLSRHNSPTGREAPADGMVRGERERIVFVEDEPFLAYLWEKMLQRLGCTVVGHTNGLEAPETFRAAPESFDLIITDQTMPHSTGERVARELLRIRLDIPVVLCTGFGHTMMEEKAKAMGIHAFLMEPLARRHLARTIRRVLNPQTPRGI